MKHKLNRGQKDKVKQFIVFTNAKCNFLFSEKCAIEVLSAYNWNLEVSVDNFFQNPPPSAFEEASSGSTDVSKIEDLFYKYKDTDDTITYTGLEKLMNDLGIDPNDIVMFILAWHLGATTLGEFTRDEFVEGLTALRIDSIDKLKQKLPSFRAEIKDDRTFKDFYSFMFEYGKAATQKILELEVAIELWNILLKDKFRHLNVWVSFLKEAYTGKAVTRDTWMLLLEFSKQINSDMSNYDAEGAWPSVLDDFVEYAKPKLQAK